MYSLCNCYDCSSNSGYNCANNWWINFAGNGLLDGRISGFVSVLGSIVDLCCIYRCSGCHGTINGCNDCSGCHGTINGCNDCSGCHGTINGCNDCSSSRNWNWNWRLTVSCGV
jgi:hypothetical protein